MYLICYTYICIIYTRMNVCIYIYIYNLLNTLKERVLMIVTNIFLLSHTGAVLTLPSRELAIISTYEIPSTKHTGAYKVEVSLYLDRKNKPTDKTGVSVNGHINIEKNSISLNGETKLTYPSQPKVGTLFIIKLCMDSSKKLLKSL